MKYYFPLHFDAGNRGCQGIAEGSAEILKESKNNIISYTTNVLLDTSVGIDKKVTLIPLKNIPLIKKIFRAIEVKLAKTSYEKRYISDRYFYEPIYRMMSKDQGIMISTGGDMLCYGDNSINTSVDYCHRHGIKTILWGCSMGPENLTEEKRNALQMFDMIYTRESLSCEFFKSIGIKSVVCLPDPAFTLKPIPTKLPVCFEGRDVIGLNLSNYVLGGYNLDSAFGQQVKEAIDYILANTNNNILLIPHVTWSNQDDRITADNVKSVYKDNPRVSILDMDALSYCQIRYIISKCRLFIGGRTHAVVSAYSTYVPTIALGYSIKAKGIAKDLGLPANLVIDTKKSNEHNLLDSLMYLIANEADVRRHLKETIPSYSQLPYKITEYIEKL